jgi:hypothetical protein
MNFLRFINLTKVMVIYSIHDLRGRTTNLIPVPPNTVDCRSSRQGWKIWSISDSSSGLCTIGMRNAICRCDKSHASPFRSAISLPDIWTVVAFAVHAITEFQEKRDSDTRACSLTDNTRSSQTIPGPSMPIGRRAFRAECEWTQRPDFQKKKPGHSRESGSNEGNPGSHG